MTVEQTSQLIQLTLNSVVMIVGCALVLGRLGVRQAALESELQSVNHWFIGLLETETEARSDRLFHARKQLRRLNRRHRMLHYSMIAIHYALLLAISSTFLLALRMLLYLDWLIPISASLFALGVAALMVGVWLTVIEIHTSDRSLWDEMRDLLKSSGTGNFLKPALRWPHPKAAVRAVQGRVARVRSSAKARVS